MLSDIKNQPPQFKEIMMLIAWILGILLLGGLVWYLSQNFREQRMIRTVNAVLMQQNDERRLQSPLEHSSPNERILRNFKRFSLINVSGNAASRSVVSGSAVVITIYDNSIPAVFAVFLDADGTAGDMLPLDNHSSQAMKRIDGKKLEMYKTHIEETERQLRSGE